MGINFKNQMNKSFYNWIELRRASAKVHPVHPVKKFTGFYRSTNHDSQKKFDCAAQTIFFIFFMNKEQARIQANNSQAIDKRGSLINFFYN
tara:strand:- start:54 stop:326 length:273 start_codon:yes stop_codon:yes gene_type:complete